MKPIKWKVFNCCVCIPHRAYVSIIAFLGLTISYIMRFCFSLAMIEMAEAKVTITDPDSCPISSEDQNKTDKRATEFDWTEYQQGMIHSSFFWGYVCTQIPGGMLAERIGAKFILTVFVGSTSICCMLTPIVARTLDWIGLICLRVTLGLCQGLVYASLHIVVANWIPPQERGTWGTLVFSGAHAGNTFNNLFTGLMLSWFPGKWPIVFYVWGVLGACWTVLFAFTTYGFPTDFTSMKPKEKQILDEYLEIVQKKEVAPRTPWNEIMRSAPVWAIIIAMIGHDWGLFALVTDVPKFIKSVLHFNIKKNGLVNAGVFLFMWIIAILSGLLVDYLQRKNCMKKIISRKIFTTVASVGPSVGLVGAAYSGCNVVFPILCLLFGMGTMGFFYPSLKVNPIDLSANYAGTLGALGHGFGALSGIAVPYLIGWLTPRSYLSEWKLVFWISFGVMSVTNIFYILFASAELQPWNIPRTKEEAEMEKQKRKEEKAKAKEEKAKAKV